MGPIVSISMPKDRLSQKHQGYGFVEYVTEEDAEYAIRVMNGIRLHGRPLKVNKAQQDKRNEEEVGANLFIGNLDSEVDERILADTFSSFGHVIGMPKVMRDPDTGMSKGFGFISYDSFEAADLAIECMNGQWLCSRQVNVSYAFKKDSSGERYGSDAERQIAMKRIDDVRGGRGGQQQQQQQRYAPPPSSSVSRYQPQQPQAPPPMMMMAPPPPPMMMMQQQPPGMMMMMPQMGGMPPPPMPPPPMPPQMGGFAPPPPPPMNPPY
jgi:splicing factor 3B subunit 4